MRNLIKRIKKIKFNFQLTIIVLLSIMLLILVIYALIALNNTENNSNLIVTPTGAVTSNNGQIVATYEISDQFNNLNLPIVNIYVDSIATLTGSEIRALKFAILKDRNLSEDEVFINFVEKTELDGRSATQTANKDSQFDLLNPSTYDYAPQNFEHKEEVISGQNFSDYIKAVQPRTDNFDIYMISTNNFVVVLKQDYSEEEFRTEYLSKFKGTENINIAFKLQTEI